MSDLTKLGQGTLNLTIANTYTGNTFVGTSGAIAASNGAVEATLPVATILSATEVGGTVTITTMGAHGFTVGETVVIAGVSVAGYNATVTITSVTTTTFTFSAGTSGLAPASGGTATVNTVTITTASASTTATGVSEVGNAVTVTTAAAHPFTVGETVVIAGITPSGYNGTYVITSVPSSTTFTYVNPVSGLAASTVAGTVQLAQNLVVGQTITIGGVSVTGYNGTFTVTATTATTFTVTTAATGLAPSGGGTFAATGGILNIQNGTALGLPSVSGATGSVTVNTPGTATPNNPIGSTLQVQGTIAVTKTLTLNGMGFGNSGALPQGALVNQVNNNTWAGDITLVGAVGLTAGTIPLLSSSTTGTLIGGVNATTLTVTGTVGGGDLTKIGAGGVTLLAPATYASNTTVLGGNLTLSNTATATGTTTISGTATNGVFAAGQLNLNLFATLPTSVVTIDQLGTLQLDNTQLNIVGTSSVGTGRLNNSSAKPNLTINGGGSYGANTVSTGLNFLANNTPSTVSAGIAGHGHATVRPVDHQHRVHRHTIQRRHLGADLRRPDAHGGSHAQS